MMQRSLEPDDDLLRVRRVSGLEVVLDAARNAIPSSPHSTTSESSLDSAPTPTPGPDSESVGSRNGDKAAVSTTAKKRRPLYLVRKEEAAALADEAKRLQKRLRQLEDQRGITESTELSTSMTLNALLSADVQHNVRHIAGIQSIVASYSESGRSNALETYIHLPVDAQERKRILLALHADKVAHATTLLLERARFLDLRRNHRQTELFDTVDVGYALICFDIIPLPSARDVPQAFEAIKYFFKNKEITLTENLGMLSIRENEEDDDPIMTTYQCRLVTAHSQGPAVESNIVAFNHFVERSELLDRPYAISAVDFVDRDDRYPYLPLECLRHNVTAGMLVTEAPPTSPDDSEPLVTMIRWGYVTTLKPQCPITPEQFEADREGLVQWGTVLPKVIRERIAAVNRLALHPTSTSRPV